MVAATRTRTRATTTAPANATKSDRGRRVSLGTLFDTKNEDFFSGPIAPQKDNYLNQSELLSLLGDAPEGQHWRIKAWVKEAKGRTVIDVVAELEPIAR